MIDILLAGILQCVMIPDFNEFSMCVDNLIVEVNEMVLDDNQMIEWDTIMHY